MVILAEISPYSARDTPWEFVWRRHRLSRLEGHIDRRMAGTGDPGDWEHRFKTRFWAYVGPV